MGRQSLQHVTLIFLDYYLNSMLTDIAGVGTNCITTFYDAVLYVSIIADIHFVENNGVLNHTVIPHEHFLE